MDNDPNLRITYDLMTDRRYQNVMIRTCDLWLLMTACQGMQAVHAIGPEIKQFYRDLGERLEAIVTTLHPEAATLAHNGWPLFSKADFDPQAQRSGAEQSYPHRDDDEPFYDDEEEW